MPKLSRKITETDLSKVTDPKDKQRIVAAVKAINVFIFIGCVAMGILQMITLHYPFNGWCCFTGWLRTKRFGVTSVETVRSALQEEVLWDYGKHRKFSTLQLIHQLQRDSLFEIDVEGKRPNDAYNPPGFADNISIQSLSGFYYRYPNAKGVRLQHYL
jgi:hypothetical protein